MTFTAPARVARADLWRIGICVAPLVVAAFVVEPFPISDSAFYEYVGRAMLRGQRLYFDVFDTKLPSIFLLNEGWQLLFGERYALHVAAETAVNALSVVLFAAILRQTGIAAWVPVSFAFAVLIGFTDLNRCEEYGMTLTLLAYLLALRGGAVASGIALAFATTFWIPTIALAVPLFLRAADSGSRRRFVLAFVVTGVAYALVMVAVFGAGTVWELVRSWFFYVRDDRSQTETARHGLFGKISLLYSALVLSAVAALVPLVLLVLRKPRNPAQSFGLWWMGCALAAPGINGQFYPHHFLPAAAPLLFAIAAYGLRWPTIRARLLLALVAVFFASKWAIATVAHVQGAHVDAVDARLAGDRIVRALGYGSVIFSEVYAPEIYLASAASLPNRFAINAPVAAMKPFIASSNDNRGRAPAAVLAHMTPRERARLREDRVLVCGREFGGWEIYVSSSTISKFACP